ncbi:MAG TPA: cytochrome c3 family protein [Anaeromyxobacteraceae bacterium]|jgi:predicted CXXCH cytochrome family protein|nr:cytochrome c3 family protein [Anaeromyxobacteraceae bacterium]
MTPRLMLASALLLLPLAARSAGVSDTVHNLSVSGPGTIKATTETQVCVFCHTPHNSNPAGPLWNHQLSSGVSYLKYTSSTMVAYTGQADAPDPNGATKLCLSCHDGTVALGAVSSQSSPIPLAAGKTNLAPGDPGYIGTDLSKTHPLSFAVTDQLVAQNNSVNSTGLALNPVSTMKSDPEVHLDGQARVQCTSCHDPHNDANYATSGVHFYAKPTRAGPCAVCHASASVPDQGPHALVLKQRLSTAGSALTADTQSLPTVGGAAASIAGAAATPVLGSSLRHASTGATAHTSPATLPLGCMSCHIGHAEEEGKKSLLQARGEQACYRCHGPGRTAEVRAGRLADRVVPLDVEREMQKPSHHPVEFPGDHKPGERLPETNPNARRHVECVDCHDAHETLPRTSQAPGTGAKRSTTRRFPSEAQLCLLCHGPAANRPANQPDASRQFAAVSFHPVLSPGRGSVVPSLIRPLTTASSISCTDCHGNNDAGGPAGPHGSIYAPLLVRNYARDDGQPESPARYDLCYGCHDRNSILSDASFPLHRKHVVELKAPCSACHSGHGADQPHLVEFDPKIVQPNGKGLRSFLPQGGGGQCFLSCHGSNHDPESYCGSGTPCAKSLSKGLFRPQLQTIPTPESLFPGWPGR